MLKSRQHGNVILLALAQRYTNVRGFFNVGPTLYQCMCVGWVARKNELLRFTVNIATVKTSNIYFQNFTNFNRLYGRLNVKNCKYFQFITLRAIDVYFII